MKTTCLLGLACVTLVVAIPGFSADYFVAPYGSDTAPTGDGTFAKPWATLKKAIEHLRTLPGGAAGATIQMRGGEYEMLPDISTPTEPALVLLPVDSGT